MDSKANGIAGSFLVTPVIDAKSLLLESLKQLDGHFLDALDFSGRKIRLLQKVKNSQ